MTSRSQIRQQIRLARQQLTTVQQQVAASKLVEQVSKLAQFSTSQHIALYLTNDGELDTSLLIQALWQLNKNVYIPVLHPFAAGYLLFIRYDQNTPLSINKFGIKQPLLECHNIIPVAELDIIFTPLVAFDQQGNRLGMGGGFYDRTLSQLPDSYRCRFIGLAHSCQQVPVLPVASWDIPLQTIVTPNRVWQFNELIP
ncbi:5-formyltetrahydrofolate cyclo-ligase [Rheinheimera sp. MMS21-TC3]|uniref:5-formyltetrahydrofolate cyclo-ligase n=1 Tax=Rheinheimera sp. MMS21-TC3 TaxID=3072790 RepID=UPI0028C3EC6C|nr:5-formyltetrahydrofolate cyclo-ligase [Rheinheimera sp. MMS21-TC3]WNO61336.1 5-formyltetrahydrofolate cyclo-ligase [Rheinheimera sp. MMS21-TC3]